MATETTQPQPATHSNAGTEGIFAQNTTSSSQAAGNGTNGNAASGDAVPGSEIKVEFQNNQPVVHVRVAAGEVIDLPLDGDFQAKLGEQGNLAIRLGDRTIILENYVAANQTHPVTIHDDKGHSIDVATVIASTDPNLDIQTAAGPAAGPAAGLGSGLFFSFNPNAGLGGFGELNVVDATALQYNQLVPDATTTLRALADVSLTIPGFGAPGTLVSEAGLEAGSHAGDGSNITTGTITISAPDIVNTIVIDGTTVTLNDLQHLGTSPKTIHTPDGTLTLTSWDGSHLGYTYTLTTNTKNVDGANSTDPISITVTDNDGKQASGTLTVQVADDAPVAHADSMDLGKADYSQHTGNVITGAGEDNPSADADIKGADGAKVTSVTFDGQTYQVGDGGVTIGNPEGNLTINPDGSYTFTRNPSTPGGEDLTYNYTLTDGDGSTSSATLTIHIPDATPTVTVPGVDGCDTTVREAGLWDGSDPHSHSNVTSGAIHFTPGDGPAGVTIDGHAVTGAGQVIKGDHGFLIITGYNATTGEIDYKYVLTKDAHNHDGHDASDNFTITVTDTDGDQASATLDISIVDDRPVAHDDSVTLGKTDYSTHHGNVITGAGDDYNPHSSGADTLGADGAKVTSVTFGGHSHEVHSWGTTIYSPEGELTIYPDGSYAFTRNPGTPGGEDLTFKYTLTDGDGSKSSADLTIHIPDAKPTLTIPCAGGDTTVHESGLSDGTDPHSHSNVATGAIHFTPGDGPATVSINGTDVTGKIGQTIAGEHGFLTITGYNAKTGEIDYKYTLTENTDNHKGQDSSDDFTVTVTDQDRDQASGSLNISIVDDKPVAHDDSVTLGKSDYSTHHGNVMTGAGDDYNPHSSGADQTGADGAKLTSVTFGQHTYQVGHDGVTISTPEGDLTINQDGSYTFTRDPGTSGGEDLNFKYTLTDGDGSTSSADLTIHIPDAKPTLTIPCADGSDTTVHEAGLSDGSDPHSHSNVTSGSINVTPGDGPDSVTISVGRNTIHLVDGHSQTIHGTYGDLTATYDAATGKIDYTYTLTDSTNNHSGHDTTDSFTVSVTDKDGDSTSGSLDISIVDDKPVANDDNAVIGLHDNGQHTGNVITGDGDSNAGGADTQGADGAKVTSVSVNGHDHQVASHGQTTIQGQYGTLVINADGSYTYTETKDAPSNSTDVFHYTLTDSDGSQSSATLTIHTPDTPPTLTGLGSGDGTVYEAGLPAGTDHADPTTTGGSFNYTTGGGSATVTVSFDGQTVNVTSQPHQIDGQYGTLTVWLDHKTGQVDYSYTLTTNAQNNHDANATDSFGVTVTNSGSHEQATGSLDISIVDDQPIAPNGNGVVYEGGLPSGHDNSPGIPDANDHGAPTTAHITLTGVTVGADHGAGAGVSFDASAQPQNLTSDGHDIQYRVDTTADGKPELIGYIEYTSSDNNSTTDVDVFTLVIDPATQSATFTLQAPIDHPDTTKEDTLDLGLKYNVNDSDGDTKTGTITVTVHDDSPTAGSVTSPTVVEPGESNNGHTSSYEVDAGNYASNSDITITAGFVGGNHADDHSAVINTNPASDGSTGIGVSSDAGNGQARYDEINYLGDGSHQIDSEYMSVHLTGGKEATSAVVNLTELYSGENGVGNETGAYMLYRDGQPVSGWIAFTATSSDGKLALNIDGPAGGFDEIRFIATQGTSNPNGNTDGSDSSDYSVHDVTFTVPDHAPTTTTVTGNLPVAFGADGPRGSGAVVLTDQGATGLTYNGVAIKNVIVNGIVEGMAGDTVVYTLALVPGANNTYTYDFELNHPIDGHQNNTTLPFHYAVTDNDGDHAQGTINIQVSDAPTAQNAVILTDSHNATVSDAGLLQFGDGSNSKITSVGTSTGDTGSVNHNNGSTTYAFAGGASDFTGSGQMSEGKHSDWGNSTSHATEIDRSAFELIAPDKGQLVLSGSISSSNDVDVFALHLDANEQISASFGNNSSHIGYEILDAAGHVVYSSSDNGSGFTSANGGDYYIEIMGQNNHTGNYNVTVDINSPSATDGSYHYQGDGDQSSVTVHNQNTDGHSWTVQGTDASEILVGDAGHHNVLNGGGGDDWIMYHNGDTVDGGTSTHHDLGGSYLGDVLDISGQSGSVDLHTAISHQQISHIDTISMTGGGHQSVSLDIGDVLSIGGGTFTPNGSTPHEAVRVEGDKGDVLTLNNGTGNDHGQWVNVTSQVGNAPAGHDVFAYETGGSLSHATAFVIVDKDVTVHDAHGNSIG